jgi:uncharacterized protein YjbI with pentapeptide repeats
MWSRSRADLERANLSRARFSNRLGEPEAVGYVDGVAVVTSGENLPRMASLRGANLRDANLSGAKLCLVDLSGADLRGAT